MISPKHLKATYFSSKGLFHNLSSFTSLENRIANLPEIERGDAFEVFAEAYLKTQSLHQVEEIWPEKSLPQSLRELLNIPSDAGIDGVFKTSSGHYKAYQVKFRSNRGSLSWGGDSLGNFFGQADRVSERILFTNSMDLSDLAASRVNFYSIKGNELDCLEPSDFKTIEDWLKTGVARRERLKPKDHQQQAINAIIDELSVKDRTTAIMACGTGKTLVALRAAEKLQAKTILVLLPSLALIRQTLHDWARDHGWEKFHFLCVCSDHTVVNDESEMILFQRDLDFAVTTQPEEIAAFLNNGNVAPKIIFSTYQSCRMVAQAMPGNFAFDLAIFDEAHKTASRLATNHAFALSENNIAIKKRLFLTATPRHYNIDVKDKFGDNQLVFSMDDETIYGRVVYKLSFRAAVEQGLICDYKVLISVITSDMLNRELLKRGEVLIDGDIIKAQRIANILAIQNAVEQYGVKRIFSFHSSISAAKSFTAKTNEGVGAYLTDFATMHVSGEMSSSKRDAILSEFRDAEKALISNARCLTEGVNVPAVDMVVFVSPKRSKVDIAQAAGRAMRKHPGKERGYILIPLFMQDAGQEELEQALAKTKFDTVWDVLQAMCEQDESLVEIIAKLREARGRILGVNDSRLRERVEILGPELALKSLRDAITTRMIDRLGLSWDERFGQLVRFKEESGHCLVPNRYPENPGLGQWVQKNRWDYKKNALGSERIKRLNEINFAWDYEEAIWNTRYLDLCHFQQINGHCNVPRNYHDRQLEYWVGTQRVSYKKGKLSSIQIKQLEKIGFVWDCIEENWHSNYSMLAEFKQKNGHFVVPKDTRENKQLATWVSAQRKLQKKGNLSSEKIYLLEQINFMWDPVKAILEERFSQILSFFEKNGHCNVPDSYDEIVPGLCSWLRSRRNLYRKNLLDIDQIKRLEEMKIKWDPFDANWEEQFEALVLYKSKNGHTSVSKKYHESPSLGLWVLRQRSKYREGSLAKERVERLNSLGFEWELPKLKKDVVAQERKSYSEIWEERFILLQQYRDIHNHCNVPQNYQDKSLAMWVGTLRTLYNKRSPRLSAEKIKKLDAIGFDWEPTTSQWENMFLKLREFKRVYGHCNVPRSQRLLATWVGVQRKQHKKNSMIPTRISRLNEIGFIWDVKKEYWHKMFHELKKFIEINGHCNVFRTGKLGNWVANQRGNYKRGTLPSAQINKLNEINFVFVPYATAWEKNYSDLCLFVRENGHCIITSETLVSSPLLTWAHNQRSDYKNGNLFIEQIKKLNDIGFVWDFLAYKWEKNFEELLKFKSVHGHCNVPGKFKENISLSHFVVALRKNYKKGILSKEQVKRLNDLGFIWDVLEEQWEKKYQDLIKFHEIYSHCNVPNDYSDQGLLSWIKNQRTYKKLGKLSPERVCKLDAIGFVWYVLDTSWDDAFTALCLFKNTYGHTKVPATRVINNIALGNWVRTQRAAHQNNKLTKERFEKLQSIDFSWAIMARSQKQTSKLSME